MLEHPKRLLIQGSLHAMPTRSVRKTEPRAGFAMPASARNQAPPPSAVAAAIAQYHYRAFSGNLPEARDRAQCKISKRWPTRDDLQRHDVRLC
jgi:hypothetical protein